MEDEALLKIAVVDDDEVDRLRLRRALKIAGLRFTMAEAADGPAALVLLAQEPFDCVFLDYQLPKQDGGQVMRQLRAAGIDVPVIFLTGLGDERLAVDLMKAGAFDYIAKDLMTADGLARSLRQVLRLHEAEKQTRAAQAALERYAQELEERNRELDAFAGTVAHNLKNVLTPIIGYAQLLEMKYAGKTLDERGQQLLDRVVQRGEDGSKTIEALLLLSRLRQQQPPLEGLDMAAIIQTVLDRLAYQVEEKEAIVTLPDSWPAAWGYAPWVEEIWVNYVSNALKYGGSPPRVELGAMPQLDGRAHFWVRDNGPGLNREEQTRLFTPFTRLAQERAEGHGLGLYIVDRIARKQAGAAGVESEINQGSTFWFSLPAVFPVDATQPPTATLARPAVTPDETRAAAWRKLAADFAH
jgi:two-component system, sensor histidine kinase and response regulator